MKVKIFKQTDHHDLEEVINYFIAENKLNVIDIIYTTGHISMKPEFYFTAMIIYKENKPKISEESKKKGFVIKSNH